MKNVNKTQKKAVVKIEAPMVGEGGWKLAYNESSKRYDLRCGDILHYSHIAHYACVNISVKRFDVELSNG